MTCFNSECIGNTDFERIAFYARKRFVEGIDTITLMTQARNEQQKHEIALAALLDLDDMTISELNFFNCGEDDCMARSYRHQLQTMLANLNAQAAG